MRDDLFPLTRAERRAAIAGWRRTPYAARREACRLAERGSPAPDRAVSAAARAWGECLLQRSWSNRRPRWLLPAVGLVATALAVLVAVTEPSSLAPAVMGIVGGVMTTTGGVLSWCQRRAGHLLVAANPRSPAPFSVGGAGNGLTNATAPGSPVGEPGAASFG